MSEQEAWTMVDKIAKLIERAEVAESRVTELETEMLDKNRLAVEAQTQRENYRDNANAWRERALAVEAELAETKQNAEKWWRPDALIAMTARAEAAEAERDKLREALDWIEAEPENPLVVQERARAALADKEGT